MDDVLPYQFEPLKVESPAENEQSDSDDSDSAEELDDRPNGDRVGDTDWCLCGTCTPMVSAHESLCCREIGAVERRADEEGVACITHHPGFVANCLNKDVLHVSLLEFVEVDGPLDDNEQIHETYRYIAYRRFVRFVWHVLGKGNRKVLPSCVVTEIRKAFPSEEYAGFKYLKI